MSGALPRWALWRGGEVAPAYSVGIEEEVMLLDPDGWGLAQASEEVLRRLSPDLAAHASAETHASAVELTTGVHYGVADAAAELATLRRRLDGGRFAAAAEFADWVWGDTGTAFLDHDDTVEIYDAHWTREIVDALAEQWHRADAILRRIDDLAAWLEDDPPARFAALLAAALRPAADESGDDPDAGDGEPPVDEGTPARVNDAIPVDSDAPRYDGGDDGRDPTDPDDGGGAGEQPLPARRAA